MRDEPVPDQAGTVLVLGREAGISYIIAAPLTATKSASAFQMGESMESWMTDLIVQVIAGALGGTGAGAALKDLSMGKAGDAITGAIGGGVVGQILSSVLGAGADVGGMDVASLVKDIVGGGVGGAVVMALIGALRTAMMKR